MSTHSRDSLGLWPIARPPNGLHEQLFYMCTHPRDSLGFAPIAGGGHLEMLLSVSFQDPLTTIDYSKANEQGNLFRWIHHGTLEAKWADCQARSWCGIKATYQFCHCVDFQMAFFSSPQKIGTTLASGPLYHPK